MANEQTEKKSYPMMPVRQWWALRERFRKTIPTVVTPAYLASTLEMDERSAQNNILPTLRATGLIDADGKPTDLVVKWRDDDSYKAVCEQVRKKVYPKELLEVAPDISTSRSKIERWFAHDTGAGENAVTKMVSFYLLITEADPAKATGSTPAPERERAVRPTPAKPVRKVKAEDATNRSGGLEPSVHLNVQIHLSPEATPEQIDAIFASMARHLKAPA